MSASNSRQHCEGEPLDIRIGRGGYSGEDGEPTIVYNGLGTMVVRAEGEVMLRVGEQWAYLECETVAHFVERMAAWVPPDLPRTKPVAVVRSTAREHESDLETRWLYGPRCAPPQGVQ